MQKSPFPVLFIFFFFPLNVYLLSSIPHAFGNRPAFACTGTFRILPFCQTGLPISQRVDDLIQRLTLKEKIQLLVDAAMPIPRLGIKGYEWWSEALHGVSNLGTGTTFGGRFPGATSFPQVILTAASLNVTLWREIGRVVSDEARAMFNGGMAGLTYWSPNVNIFRDPRWGRGQETPGEDPVIASQYAVNYVMGLQEPYGADGNRLKVAACCKHFTAYDVDNWKGVDRFHFNAQVTKQDLEDTYNKPFEACVIEGKAASLMCSYNQVNGVPTCADSDFLKGIVRNQWKLNGYIVSDCDSVDVLYKFQHYANTPEDAAAMTIKAGLDLDCGSFLGNHTEDAIKQGKLNETDVNKALVNTITVQMRLGLFDGPFYGQPFGHLGAHHVCKRSHQALALDAARQGIVLLKNNGTALPLNASRYGTVAVIGPNANVTATMIGNYAGIPCKYITPLQGISSYVKTIYQPGCSDVACGGDNLIGACEEAAKTADATILVVGLDQSVETETRDRESLFLPGNQSELITRVANASRGPTIVVIMCGGPVDISFARDDPRISAILWVGYPGEAGGQAIADVIFGAYNPGGKLPVTWYPQDFTKIPMTDMAMRAEPSRGYPGRTHRFYNGPVVFPFGHGLSYTAFNVNIIGSPLPITISPNHIVTSGTGKTLPRAINVTETSCDVLSPLTIHTQVTNIGNIDGSYTLFVYSTAPLEPGTGVQERRLVRFQKVHLAAKSTTKIVTHLDVCKDFSVADINGVRRIPIGDHKIHVGDETHTVSIGLKGF